jgi:protein-S-isoprenylcysteine O-methyltransferase Ste14
MKFTVHSQSDKSVSQSVATAAAEPPVDLRPALRHIEPERIPQTAVVRHLLAVLALPVTVTLLVPALLLRGRAVAFFPTERWEWLLFDFGLLLILLGLALAVWTVGLFARVGRGTLAPWDPPRRLVVRGPYRYVRNPMITGVAVILLGQAALFRAPLLLAWCGLFILVNLIYTPLVEEPGLRRRFGPEYDEYCRHVPRWLPRLTPWRGPAPDGQRP